MRRSIRGASLLLALGLGVVHGNALAASDVADAAMRGDTVQLNKLIAAKADVNAAQPDGSTALHWAAYHGDVKATAALLNAHANPGAAMENGMTPLALACESRQRGPRDGAAESGRRRQPDSRPTAKRR